jgi:hypothetical protein
MNILAIIGSLPIQAGAMLDSAVNSSEPTGWVFVIISLVFLLICLAFAAWGFLWFCLPDLIDDTKKERRERQEKKRGKK